MTIDFPSPPASRSRNGPESTWGVEVNFGQGGLSPSAQLTAILTFSRVCPSHSSFVANDTVISHLQLAFLLLSHCCFNPECCSACFCIRDGYAAPDAFGSFGNQYDIARQIISGAGFKGGIEILVEHFFQSGRLWAED